MLNPHNQLVTFERRFHRFWKNKIAAFRLLTPAVKRMTLCQKCQKQTLQGVNKLSEMWVLPGEWGRETVKNFSENTEAEKPGTRFSAQGVTLEMISSRRCKIMMRAVKRGTPQSKQLLYMSCTHVTHNQEMSQGLSMQAARVIDITNVQNRYWSSNVTHTILWTSKIILGYIENGHWIWHRSNLDGTCNKLTHHMHKCLF